MSEQLPAAGSVPESGAERPPVATDRGSRLFRRFVLVWAPVIVALVAVELVSVPIRERPDMAALVVLTAVTGVAAILSALSLSRGSATPLVLLAAGLADAAGIATGLVSSAGNDAALLLPFLGAVLLVGVLDDRSLVVAFVIQWVAGMVGSAAAYGYSDLRLVPGREPVILSLTAAGVMTFIGYCLLWWVRDRLIQALRAARTAERQARAAEQAATLSAQTLEALLMSSPVPTVAFDLDRVIRAWNPAAERLFGWGAAAMVGSPLYRLVPEPEHPLTDGWIARALNGDVVRGELAEWRRMDGELVALEIHAAVRRDANGQPVGVVSQIVDATEREALLARMAEVERLEAVGQLAGGIAHDFNNLLTAVSGYAELLRDETAASDPRLMYVTEIERAAWRGAELVRQLLAFSRRQVLEPIVLDLNSLLDGLRPMLERVIGSELILEIVHEPALGLVRADAGRLEQVIVNLAVNARDAMPDGGTITFRTANVDHLETRVPGASVSFVQLTVADTGVGMDQATLSRAFEPFFTTKSAGKGTGLGLATAYGTVTQSGGFIHARSAPGRGTTVEIDLPRIAGSVAETRAAAPPFELPRGTETVLIVDDEMSVRELAGRILQGLGYRVLLAGDTRGAMAAALTEQRPIDLVLTDVVMPDVRGPVLAKRLAAIHPTLRVAYMSGYAMDVLKSSGLSSVDGPFLAKPFSVAELAGHVRSALDRSVAMPGPGTG